MVRSSSPVVPHCLRWSKSSATWWASSSPRRTAPPRPQQQHRASGHPSSAAARWRRVVWSRFAQNATLSSACATHRQTFRSWSSTRLRCVLAAPAAPGRFYTRHIAVVSQLQASVRARRAACGGAGPRPLLRGGHIGAGGPCAGTRSRSTALCASVAWRAVGGSVDGQQGGGDGKEDQGARRGSTRGGTGCGTGGGARHGRRGDGRERWGCRGAEAGSERGCWRWRSSWRERVVAVCACASAGGRGGRAERACGSGWTRGRCDYPARP